MATRRQRRALSKARAALRAKYGRATPPRTRTGRFTRNSNGSTRAART